MRFRRVIRAAAAALASLPAAALADPISLGAAVSYLAGGSYIALGLGALGAVYQSSRARRQARKAAADARAAYVANLTDRTATVLSATPSWQVVYGRCVAPGTVLAIFHSDKAGTRENGVGYTRPDGYIHYVVEFAHHQCQAINEVYVDGTAIGPVDASGWATSGDYYATRQDSRVCSIAGSSSLDVGETVLSIISAYYINSDTATDVSPGVAGSVITNPSAFTITVDYAVTVTRKAVRWSGHLGDANQTVDTYLTGVRPTEWDSTHRLRGVTYITLTLDQEDQRFADGHLPLIQADISGKLVYDPRTGVTAWSDNPPLITRDWLTSPWGYNCTGNAGAADDIDDAYTIASANGCDVSIVLDDGAGPYAGKKYTCNGAFTSAQARESVLADLDECMAGHVVYGAQWMIQAGYWTAPVTLPGGGGLTDDDLDGQISLVQADTPTDELFNGVRGTYVPKTVAVGSGTGYLISGSHAVGATSIVLSTGSGTVDAGNGIRIAGDDNTYEVATGISAPGTLVIQQPGLLKAASNGTSVAVVAMPKSAPTDIRPPYSNSAYVTADGGALWQDLALPFTNAGARARNIARVLTEKARHGRIYTYPAKLRAVVLKVGDRITVTSGEYGDAAETYRVTDRKFGLTSPVVLTLQLDAEDIYDEADAATAEPRPGNRLVNPWFVSPIAGLAVVADSTVAITSNGNIVTPRAYVSWTAIADRYVIERGRIEVLWRAGDSAWQQMNVPGDATSVYLVGLKHDDRLVIEVRAVNGLGKVGPSVFIGATVNSPIVGTTDIFSNTPGSAVTVTAQSHTPDLFGFNTQVATISFTPKASGNAQVYFDGRGNYINSTASIADASWSVQDTAGTGTYDAWKRLDVGIPASATVSFSMSTTRTIAVTGGTAYTFAIYAHKLNAGDTFTVDNMQLRVEVVKA